MTRFFKQTCYCSILIQLSLLPQFVDAETQIANTEMIATEVTTKPVIYQVFTRLFGNTNSTNKPWGTLDENGVGKFSDFTPTALESIKSLGVSHIWYTGVPHHALVNDYRQYGISLDDPDVVKGRAGSPYAVKDYYNVDPDLADNPAERLAEFEALIARTHRAGMKVIIDIVPNHVARGYQSLSKPKGVTDFGERDDTSVEYARDNNFYYVVDTPFSVPDLTQPPLGGEINPLIDGKFSESPAKWTGNGSRLAKPDANDWYETVKINYGVKPDASLDFPRLTEEFATKSASEHSHFWQQVPANEIPDSWKKFHHITQYWLAKGVDGFRYDMAEMVPVEFWSYLNSQIKHANPNALLLAEVYTPARYRDYIYLGKMDYLYDKVGLYDTLKAIIKGEQSTAAIELNRKEVDDIASHMLHFLENHDEQRIASPEFAGNPFKALPAMVISTTLSSAPTLLYFGQEVGEDGSEDAGFGQPSRTSIFDYVGVPAHQRYMNKGKFDGAKSTRDELKLRGIYAKLLNLSHQAPALLGEYVPLDNINREQIGSGYDEQTFAFARYSQQQKLIVVSNFSSDTAKTFNLALPSALIDKWQLKDGQYPMTNRLTDGVIQSRLIIEQVGATIALELAPLESMILEVESQ